MNIETTIKLDDILKNIKTPIYVSPTAAALINESPIFIQEHKSDMYVGKYKDCEVYMADDKPFIDMKIYNNSDEIVGDLSEILSDMGLNFDITDDNIEL